MSIKRMSLRFNLDNEADRKAWKHLKNTANSKNKAVITAINQFYEPHTEIIEVIRKTIRECLQNLSVIQMVQTATFRGQQGRISRPVKAILSGRL